MTKILTTVLGASLLFAGATFASAQETRPVSVRTLKWTSSVNNGGRSS